MKATTKIMGRESHLKEEGGIVVKDFVWAKVKGHSWWPAEVLNTIQYSFLIKIMFIGT